MGKAQPSKSHTRQKPQPSKDRKPIILSEEDFELLDRGDFIGLEYLQARRVRAKRRPTAAERTFLREHAAVEAQIQSDPKAVLKQARATVDEGSVLLLKLIRSRKLLHQYPEDSWDDAFNCFATHLRFVNEQFVRLAEDRTPKASFHLWYRAMNLADALVRLAAAFPEDFRPMAESSLTMPSLRARSPKFSCDAGALPRPFTSARNMPPQIFTITVAASGHCAISWWRRRWKKWNGPAEKKNTLNGRLKSSASVPKTSSHLTYTLTGAPYTNSAL